MQGLANDNKGRNARRGLPKDRVASFGRCTNLLEEWAKITLEEIRERISDMPRRCAELIRIGGKRIRGPKF
jgi:hypothetical protein